MNALPLFRSEHQARLLALLFAADRPVVSVSEAARRCGVRQPTASREIASLERAGLVTSRLEGRNRMVSGAWAQPWAQDLANLLAKTVGVPAAISRALKSVNGVEDAFIFGSWAARMAGEAGPPPRDVDVLVIGDPDPNDIRRACRNVGRAIGYEVNAVAVTRERWDHSADDSFIETVKAAPLVQVLAA